MAKVDLVMPKMGESIMEATILNWVKKVGDKVAEDETILEIATDKVDSEIPSPVDGVITEILFEVNETIEVGKIIARIETAVGAEVQASPTVVEPVASIPEPVKETIAVVESIPSAQAAPVLATQTVSQNGSSAPKDRFYSPLVRNIAQKENIAAQELSSIPGTGANGRVTKKDILNYVANRSTTTITEPIAAPDQKVQTNEEPTVAQSNKSNPEPAELVAKAGEEIIEMDRMRKMIADHMVMSKHTSPHVTSFVEADVTNLVNWRNKVKGEFQSKYGEKITFTPIFIEAVVKAIKDFPMVNVSVSGNKIIKKNNINIGMAAALPSGNLIVPVIKNADTLNMVGITKTVNDLANRARQNKLKPEEIQGGTFTLTNVGTFGNVMGTPIINQPQAAILAVGAIRKKPAVVETEFGDLIAVRQMMFLSLSYDHRVVDGFLGGSFLRKVADYLEEFDHNQSI